MLLVFPSNFVNICHTGSPEILPKHLSNIILNQSTPKHLWTPFPVYPLKSAQMLVNNRFVNLVPRYSSPSTQSIDSRGKHFNNRRASFVCVLVSQIMSTWSKVSPKDPRYCICQHASWSYHFPRGSWRLKHASIGNITCKKFSNVAEEKTRKNLKTLEISKFSKLLDSGYEIAIVDTQICWLSVPCHRCTWTWRIARG